MEITKEVRNILKEKGQVKVTFKINYMNYLEMMKICELKKINMSQYIRGLIVNDLKHPSYDIEKGTKKVLDYLFTGVKND